MFDLTKPWEGPAWSAYRGAYDLVLCEQVLEHFIDSAQAALNLALLLRKGGVLHISVPATNNRHGEPLSLLGFCRGGP